MKRQQTRCKQNIPSIAIVSLVRNQKDLIVSVIKPIQMGQIMFGQIIIRAICGIRENSIILIPVCIKERKTFGQIIISDYPWF